MCKCIEFLAEWGYVSPNLLAVGEYFLYPIQNNKILKTPLLIKFCPSCGRFIGQGKSLE